MARRHAVRGAGGGGGRPPDATALVADGERWPFETLLAESRALAGGLDRLGVGPGDTVTVWLGNRPE